MREMPYIQPYHVGNRRGGNQNILDEFREFLMRVEDEAVVVVEAA
jgi:hypothetical protein